MQLNCRIRDCMRMKPWVAMIGTVCASVVVRAKGVTGNGCKSKGGSSWQSLAASHYDGGRRQIPVGPERLDRVLLGVLGRVFHR